MRKKISNQIVEQIIRPTGLVDPKIIIRPITEKIKCAISDIAHNGQVDDSIVKIKEKVLKNERVLVTTLTKKMAEDLTDYLHNKNIYPVKSAKGRALGAI